VDLNLKGLEKRILADERMLLDTSVLIAYFEPSDATHDVAVLLIETFVKQGRNAALVSPVTAMEILVRPLKVKPAAAIHVHDFLSHWPNLSLLPIDLHVAQEAASLRATHNFKTPDALVIATGIVGQVRHLVTNDAEWNKRLLSMKARVQVTEPTNYISELS
jgi:predicted nucleic acid-binding protein